MIFGRLICWRYGHKRGKRVAVGETGIVYRCPRCKAEWVRKVTKKKAAQ